MYENICALCKTKFYSNTNENSNLFDDRRYKRKSHKIDRERPFRTSTPISDIVNDFSSSSSDTVSDFFYQSWKSGLQTSRRRRAETTHCSSHMIQQFPCYSQIIYINTVQCPPMYSMINSKWPQVGYRADGTFGVLPMYYAYFVNY